MRIKGIKTGKNKGDVIELTPEDKLKEAVKMACSEGKHFDGYLTWATNIKTKDLNVVSAGSPLKGKYANNLYTAAGSAAINFRNIAKDQVEPPKTMDFEVKFKDVTDSWGMPDLEVTQSSFQ